ncbi:MAG: ATP phosphoribosyltransferase regulatory subunit [Chloroflexi bacterium CG08_land_8_20_14_0_20_45_12]|nr:MAG: ATP phosphoribosyltransferase regulatory subunit [Chloroflexi bacterium CG08_land_8_20_14_0_20_45_12]PIX27596.1 MAG: ATP phosphoribosyltransferase regulatory subunit [Chloroflexi bacterium CG_4_8_14_3_um_filter_45_15]
MKNQKSKGMRDLLPDDMLRFRYIEDTFRRCCLGWGYQEVRTPTIEYLHLFTATGTLIPSMLGRAYSFLDWDGWSGERVVLKPDGTIPLARLYIDNLSEQKIARFFYITNIFAFEETGRENRERWQCGAEFLGGGGFVADVEAILLAQDVLRKLGIKDIELQLSHAGLIKALIRELKLGPDEESKVTNRILEGDWRALAEAKTTNAELSGVLSQIVSLKGKSSNFLQNLGALFQHASPNFKLALGDFMNIAALLESLDYSYEIDITAMHGFEYYTGVCFEILSGGEKIAGGGRYDDLIPLMGGENIPSCGFALYVDPIMKLLPLENRGEVEILVKGEELTTEVARTCFTLAQSLRDAGHATELALNLFQGSEQERNGYRWVISVSAKKPFILKDCKQRQQRSVTSLAEVLDAIGTK